MSHDPADPVPPDAIPPDALPPDAIDANPAPIPPSSAPVVAAQRIKFCRGCGSPWEPAWSECPRCAVRHARTAEISVAYTQERRSIFSAVWLYFALLAVSAATMLALTVLGHHRATVMEEFVESGVMSLITLGWCFAAYRDLLPLLRKVPNLKWFGVSVVLACVTYVIAASMMGTLVRLLKMEDLRYLENFETEGYHFAWAVLAICVQPALFEELAFRGVILSALGRALSSREAVLVSALMFAILHLSVPAIPHLFLMGFLLGWLRTKTGSLYPGMLMHFTHNLLVLIAERHGGGMLPW